MVKFSSFSPVWLCVMTCLSTTLNTIYRLKTLLSYRIFILNSSLTSSFGCLTNLTLNTCQTWFWVSPKRYCSLLPSPSQLMERTSTPWAWLGLRSRVYLWPSSCKPLYHQIQKLDVHQFSSVQLLSHVRLFATPWIAARQASLSITNSQSSLKLTSIELVMPSSHLILCCPLLLLPPIPPSIRVFSNESTLLRMKRPKYWSFSFSIIPSKEHPGRISFRCPW